MGPFELNFNSFPLKKKCKLIFGLLRRKRDKKTILISKYAKKLWLTHFEYASTTLTPTSDVQINYNIDTCLYK
jgi:hypothetical protein